MYAHYYLMMVGGISVSVVTPISKYPPKGTWWHKYHCRFFRASMYFHPVNQFCKLSIILIFSSSLLLEAKGDKQTMVLLVLNCLFSIVYVLLILKLSCESVALSLFPVVFLLSSIALGFQRKMTLSMFVSIALDVAVQRYYFEVCMGWQSYQVTINGVWLGLLHMSWGRIRRSAYLQNIAKLRTLVEKNTFFYSNTQHIVKTCNLEKCNHLTF